MAFAEEAKSATRSITASKNTSSMHAGTASVKSCTKQPSGVIMEEKRKAVILNQLSSQNARWGLNPMATELSADVFGSFSS